MWLSLRSFLSGSRACGSIDGYRYFCFFYERNVRSEGQEQLIISMAVPMRAHGFPDGIHPSRVSGGLCVNFQSG